MASALESAPRINPALLLFAGAARNSVSGSHSGTGIPIWVYILAAAVVYACIHVYSSIAWVIETPANIRTRLRTFVEKYNVYADRRSSRQGLSAYLDSLRRAGVPDSHFALTNFYVSSANTAATFTPVRDGIVSQEAVKLAIAAGARYLDFTIYPDGRTANYRPIVTEMDAGSNWRRLPMNEITFRAAMDAVQQNAIAGPRASAGVYEAPYKDDPLFIMLRFMGAPKLETFDQTADALRETIEPFRLDFTYYKVRGMDKLWKTPITEFRSKVIIISNVYPPESSTLNDYINIGPRGAVPLEMSIREVGAIPEQNKGALRAKILQNFTITRSVMEEPDSDKNDWDFKKAHDLGIHFAGMNFWNSDDALKEYLNPGNFGVFSFKIKPADMRHIIEYAKPPALPNPELNARDGKPIAPPGIVLPA